MHSHHCQRCETKIMGMCECKFSVLPELCDFCADPKRFKNWAALDELITNIGKKKYKEEQPRQRLYLVFIGLAMIFISFVGIITMCWIVYHK